MGSNFASSSLKTASFPPDFPFCVSIPDQDLETFYSLSFYISIPPNTLCSSIVCVPPLPLLNSSVPRGQNPDSFFSPCHQQIRSIFHFPSDRRLGVRGGGGRAEGVCSKPCLYDTTGWHLRPQLPTLGTHNKCHILQFLCFH